MRDQRRLPVEVRRRLRDAGLWAPERRTPGVDLTVGSRIVEERRTQRGILVRSFDSTTDEATRIVGHAYTYTEYDMYGGPPLGWTESIAEGASTKTLGEARNVPLNYNHGGLPLAATRAGTLELAEDETGLRVDASPDMTSPYTREIASRIARGELDRMSFAFRVTGEEWEDDFTRRIIRELELFDVSVVDVPANDGTDVSLAQDGDPEDDEPPASDEDDDPETDARRLWLLHTSIRPR